MTKKHVQDRREKLRRLGEMETAARCAYGNCRQPLPKMFIEAGFRFCDDGCRTAEEAWTHAREVRR